MIKMNHDEANYLSQIYNTFFKVQTSGENTIIMGRALEALQDFMSKSEIIQEGENDTEQEG